MTVHSRITPPSEQAQALTVEAPQTERLSSLPLPIAFTAIAISCGMAFRAFDGSAGQAFSAILNATLLYAAVVRQPPTRDFWLRALPVLGLAAAAIGWGLFATLGVSGGVLPDYVLGKLLSLVSAISALLVGTMMARGRRRRRALLDWLLLSNALLLFAGLLFRELGMDALFPYWTLDRLGRFCGLASNANVTAAIAACCAFIAFVRLTGIQRHPAWASPWVKGYIAHLPLFAICTGVVIITGSRFTAGVLSLALILYLVRWKLKKRINVARMAAVSSAVLLLILMTFFFSSVLASRYNSLEAGWADRIQTWSVLWDAFLRQPVTGYGLGSFPTLHAHLLSSPHYAQANWAVNSPHNIGLQMLLQAGAPYFLLIMAAWAVGGVQVLLAVRGRWIRDNVLIAVLICLLTACAMVDIALDMPAPLTLLMFLAGLLWGQALHRREVAV